MIPTSKFPISTVSVASSQSRIVAINPPKRVFTRADQDDLPSAIPAYLLQGSFRLQQVLCGARGPDPADRERSFSGFFLDPGIFRKIDHGWQYLHATGPGSYGSLSKVIVTDDHHGSTGHDRIDLLSEKPSNNPTRVQIVVVKDCVVIVKDIGDAGTEESFRHQREPGEQFLFDPDEVVSLQRSKLPDPLVDPPQDRPDVMSLLLI